MRVTTAFDVDASEIQGRKSDASALISKLLENSGEDEARNGPPVISIVGTGGIGKTTLAQLVFGDEKIKTQFDERVWICVSDPFDQIKIAKAIVESTTKSSTDLSQLQLLLEKIQSTLSGKRFLLVMDDVWTEQYAKWEPLKNSLKDGLPGSRILVTSRSERVARMMGSAYLHHLDLISDEEAWLLLSRIAFSGRRENDCEKLALFEAIVDDYFRRPNFRFQFSIEFQCKLEATTVAAAAVAVSVVDVMRAEAVVAVMVAAGKVVTVVAGVAAMVAAGKVVIEVVATAEVTATLGEAMMIAGGANLALLLRPLKDIGQKIAQKCKGLPLAAKVMGSLLCFKDTRDDWQNVLDNKIWELDEVVTDLFPHLHLSYNDLTPKMKQCFSYCAVFPKMHDIVHDYEIEFLTKNECYSFNQQKIGRNMNLTASNCDIGKLHSIFAECLSPEELTPDLFNSLKSVRVLRLHEFELQELPKEVGNLLHLRYIDLSRSDVEELPDAICSLYNLQTLDLSRCNWFSRLPEGIGNLCQLRYIDLSRSDVEELPDAVCSLYNLQTLDLSECSRFSKLPEGIGKLRQLRYINLNFCKNLEELPKGIANLINLRHLYITSTKRLEMMPQGIAKLTQLCSLSEFKVGKESSKLGYMEKLNQLKGELSIIVLSDLNNAADVEEAKKA
ncbi:PREDICTED: putative disease resistance protein RGA3 [Ipomoea nil]|uniref:putative disease resistance protein RGA3 n=1 Tax=Ipomoea nil TaxID=35883 RepID=UPI000901DE1D|nr:PREDICTED: putative disease resistance protein RGA3 [Ipomoea nil]